MVLKALLNEDEQCLLLSHHPQDQSSEKTIRVIRQKFLFEEKIGIAQISFFPHAHWHDFQ